MHGEFLRLLFLQAHRETEAHFLATGLSSQNINPEALRFKRAEFYNGLKSKVGLAAAKAAALRINLNVRECCLLVLNLVSSTLSWIRRPRPRLLVLDVCGFVQVCTQAFIGFKPISAWPINPPSSGTLA